MATMYSFESNVNELFDSHRDTYVTPVAETVTRSIESIKQNLRKSDIWSMGHSDNDGTYFTIVERIPTIPFHSVYLDSTVVFHVYKHRILINIQLPFSVSGTDAIRRLADVANDAFTKSAMPCDFPITLTLKFSDGYEFYTMEYSPDEEGTNAKE